MRGHSPLKTGVNALVTRASTSFAAAKQGVDGRVKPGHDN
jgi:hypothetical protein